MSIWCLSRFLTLWKTGFIKLINIGSNQHLYNSWISMNLFHLWSSYIFMRKISLFLWCFTYYIGVKYKFLQNYKSPVCHIIKGGHWISSKQISTFPNYKEARAMAEIMVSPHTNQPDLYRSEIWKPMPMSQARCLTKKMFKKNREAR